MPPSSGSIVATIFEDPAARLLNPRRPAVGSPRARREPEHLTECATAAVWNTFRVLFLFGEYQLDDQRLNLLGPAGPIHLEPQVFGVLHYLIVNRDRVVSKEELLDGVWATASSRSQPSRRG